MPLDKDVFVVSLGRRDVFYSFPKRNQIELRKTEDLEKAGIGRCLDTKSYVTSHREPTGVRSINEPRAPIAGRQKSKGDSVPYRSSKLRLLDKRMQRLNRGLPLLHR